MAVVELNAYAKINLSLDVISKRPDGYHEIKTVMQTIGLHDKVFVETVPDGIHVETDCESLPSGEENIAYKAARLLIEKTGIKGGVRIKIKKWIPVAAGLAGGSSDAAAVLKAINVLYRLNLDQGRLMEIGRMIGADVPYCIAGGTTLAEGIGDRLTPLKEFRGIDVILLKPRTEVATSWVYSRLDLERITERPDTQAILKAIDDMDAENVAKNMRNVLENVTIPSYPVIKEAKDRLLELGATGAVMSGSGPSVFGLFPQGGKVLWEAYEKISDDRWDKYLTKTI